MLPGANIVDQLLGGFEIKPTGQAGTAGSSGVSAEGMEQGLLFGDLLMQSMTEGEPGGQIISNLLFPSNDQPVAQDEAMAGPTVERGSLLELVAPAETASVDTEKLIRLRPDMQAMPTATPINGEKPLELPITDINNLTNLEALPHLETELESGVFRVLDSKIVDGRLELTAVAEGSSEEPVKISVPESILKGSALKLNTVNNGPRTGRIAAVPIDGLSSTQLGQLDDLLSRLNLKTLEVKIEPEMAVSKPSMNPVEITIVAEQGGAEIALKSKIVRQAIQIRSEQKDSNKLIKSGEPNTLIDSESKQSVAAKSTMLDVGADSMRRDTNLTQFTLADRFGGGRVGMTNDNLPYQVSFENTLEPLTSSVESKITPTVKMTLPDMIQKPFSAGGQTVMIKIEPEHLGPARLNLVMRDHVLTARVVVDTPIARMAVLNSLDQLTDQLSRAGIDVNRIDVALSGDSAREQFLDRRPAWDYAQKTHNFDDEYENGSETVTAAPILTTLPPEYIGADRVNLLA